MSLPSSGEGKAMYAKLIFRNAKRSVKDYLIYIMTMTICVTLFYSFLSISSSYYNPDIGSEYDVTLLSDGLKTAVCMITLLLLFLIRFVNNYMLRRKKKEFAVQSVMGMEPKTIGRIFFAETAMMGILSIIIGISLGVLCSQCMTAMLLTAFGRNYELSWTLFPDTVLLTVCFFMLSFFIVGIWNIHTIQKAKIIDMLSADKENEPELAQSRWIWVIVMVFEFFTVWMLITGTEKAWFYYDSRFAFPVRMMFLGNIVFPAATLLWSVFRLTLFCRKTARSKKNKYSMHTLLNGLLACSALNIFAAASVPALTGRYHLSWGAGTVRQYLLFLLVHLIFLICALIYLFGTFLASWKEKSPEHRYKGENLFFFGQIISRLDTASKSMTIICVTLTLAIFLFAAAPVLTGWSSGYLDMRSVYDVQIFSRYNNVYEEENLPQDNYQAITDFLREHHIETSYDCTFSLYLPDRNDFHNRGKYTFPIAAISLGDYNAIREMLGYEPISLADNEFATQWKTVAAKEEAEKFLAEHAGIMTDGGALTLSRHPYYNEAMGVTIYNSYTDVLYIFPDNVCRKLLPVIRNRYIITTEKITYEHAAELERLFTEKYPEQTEEGAAYGVRFRTLQVNSTKANNFILQASMLYGAVVLMVICLTMLSLQQLSDAGQYKYRFSVLRNLGVEEQRIEKLIRKQLSIWFGVPIAVAVAAAAIIIAYFIQTISAEISAYIGYTALLLQLGATAGILTVLLICYFLSTWILFRHSVT